MSHQSFSPVGLHDAEGRGGCCGWVSPAPAPAAPLSPLRAGQGERDGPSSLPWPPPRGAAALSPAVWGQPRLGWGRGGRARGETSGETSLLLPGAGLRRQEAELAPSPLALGGCWGLARPRPGFGTDEFPGSPELSRGLLVGARSPLRPPSLAVRWRAAGQSLAHAQPFCRHLHTLDRSV